MTETKGHPPVVINHPPHPNGSHFIKWALAITMTLLAAGIGGAVATYGKVSALEQAIAGLRSRMDRIEDKLDRVIEEKQK
jgi:hypothetical protein